VWIADSSLRAVCGGGGDDREAGEGEVEKLEFRKPISIHFLLLRRGTVFEIWKGELEVVESG
jgi:hypothetical protein